MKENAQATVDELGIEATVENVDDINVITGFGVMITPALAVEAGYTTFFKGDLT